MSLKPVLEVLKDGELVRPHGWVRRELDTIQWVVLVNFWSGVGSKDSFGDLSTPVNEKQVLAWSLVPFQELLEGQFTESIWDWEWLSPVYTMADKMYKGRRAKIPESTK